jgi:hypothetical protein
MRIGRIEQATPSSWVTAYPEVIPEKCGSVRIGDNPGITPFLALRHLLGPISRSYSDGSPLMERRKWGTERKTDNENELPSPGDFSCVLFLLSACFGFAAPSAFAQDSPEQGSSMATGELWNHTHQVKGENHGCLSHFDLQERYRPSPP